MSERDPVRLFLALWPGAPLRARLADYRNGWQWPAGARPVADEALHVTLHFVGALARARLPELLASLAAVAAAETVLRPAGAGVWRGGVAVLRIEDDAALADLHGRLADVLTSSGIALDPRPFAPHVTLARKAANAEPPATPPAFQWRASDFVLIESIPGGVARYEVLRRFGATPRARSDIESA